MEVDGYLDIGDVGYLDQDGFLYLNDRSTDMIISGGVNIYPAEIEACLLELDGVRDVAVFGIPDEEFGEAVAAHVEASGLTEDQVREHVEPIWRTTRRPRSSCSTMTCPEKTRKADEAQDSPVLADIALRGRQRRQDHLRVNLVPDAAQNSLMAAAPGLGVLDSSGGPVPQSLRSARGPGRWSSRAMIDRPGRSAAGCMIAAELGHGRLGSMARQPKDALTMAAFRLATGGSELLARRQPTQTGRG